LGWGSEQGLALREFDVFFSLAPIEISISILFNSDHQYFFWPQLHPQIEGGVDEPAAIAPSFLNYHIAILVICKTFLIVSKALVRTMN
jgi:hypothetical protein